MDNEQIARIKEYIHIINPSVVIEDNDLLDFCINEVGDRVQLYLNSDTIPTIIERIIAKIINTGLIKCQRDIELSSEGQVDRAINSVSDNGQSISYANEVTKYFTNANDEELFSGFTSLLSRYRRVKVVYPKNNDESNS